MSINNNINGQLFDLPKSKSNIIKVIGVGGGGSNAVNYMFNSGIKGVDYIVCNTDAQALENSPVLNKIQLGINVTKGLGAGSNPEVGEKAAEESLEYISNILDTNTEMVFITAGMGGGTGTGAAPVIAKLAKEKGILTIGIVTIPYRFEGPRRNRQAMAGIEKLRKNVDSLIVINNNKLTEIYGDIGIEDNFTVVNEILLKGAKGMAEVISKHYLVNIDMEDARTVLQDGGTAIMGSAVGEGENRALEAVTNALNSPLLNDNRIVGAKNALTLIVYGTKQALQSEVSLILEYVQKEAGGSLDTDIIYGIGKDESLGEGIYVTVVATGFDTDQQHEILNNEHKKVIHVLDDNQPITHDLTRQTKPVVNQLSWGNNNSINQPQIDLKRDNISISDLFNTWVDCEILSAEQSFKIIEQPRPNFQESFTQPTIKERVQPQQTLVKPQSQPNREAPKAVLFELDEVHKATKRETPQPNERGEIFHNLGDYMDFEEELIKAKPMPTNERSNEFVVFTRKESDEMPTPNIEGQQMILFSDEDEKKNIDPVNSRISDVMTRRSDSLHKYNHKFGQTNNGYTDNNHSRISIGKDSSGEFQIRKNNSFLHDNVD